ncbi:fms-related tyrosine kinase 3 ligand isoform X3 [Phyllobates terribilis]|uniref:fms-related tyrosine kinase 3 ligand isoform X3 n=1 Tax=Phyllobates terribilis TaxID=111132 RepID=UPI003CCB57DF
MLSLSIAFPEISLHAVQSPCQTAEGQQQRSVLCDNYLQKKSHGDFQRIYWLVGVSIAITCWGIYTKPLLPSESHAQQKARSVTPHLLQIRPGKSQPPFSPPASKFSYEDMINCHVFRVKDIVFFWLVICLGIGNSCIFENDPISDEYMMKTEELADYLPGNYEVDFPRIISEEKEDQNCHHLLRLFLSNSVLVQIPRRHILNKPIINLQKEIHFTRQCSFKIPSSCPKKKVNMYTVLQNLNESLAALKPYIKSSFIHCLPVKCETADEQVITMKSTIESRGPNHGLQDSTIYVLREEHTTPTLNINGSSSDHIIDSAKQSGARHRYCLFLSVFVILFVVLLAYGKSRSQDLSLTS